MTSSAKTKVVAAAALLAVGYAFYEWTFAQRALAAERGFQAQIAGLTAKLRTAEQDLQQAKRQQADLRQAVSQAQAARAAALAAAAAKPPATRRSWLGAHPEALARYLTAFREVVGSTYGPLFQSLNLTPDQIEKLKDLLTRQETRYLTVTDATLASELARANNAAMRAVVGRDNYQALHNYGLETAVVPLVADVSAAASAANAPLTAAQAVQLTAALAASSQHRANYVADLNTVNWDQATTGAQAILSPVQQTP